MLDLALKSCMLMLAPKVTVVPLEANILLEPFNVKPITALFIGINFYILISLGFVTFNHLLNEIKRIYIHILGSEI